MDKAIQIAKYMLSKKPLTPKQVQKLLYYAYALYLIKYNNNYDENNMNRLFDDTIEAWMHGPVVRSVYNYIKPAAYSNQWVMCDENISLGDKRTENFIDKILLVFGQYSGYELEKMTHNEDPWMLTYVGCDGDARCNKKIEDKLIYEYYSRKYKNGV